MPTLLRVGPYRFQMVMFDCLERPHVHVRGGSIGEAKVWLTPTISVADSWGYTPREVARIRVTVARNAEVLFSDGFEFVGKSRGDAGADHRGARR